MDGFSGERVSMRVGGETEELQNSLQYSLVVSHLNLFGKVDLECSDGRTTVGLYSHTKLSV